VGFRESLACIQLTLLLTNSLFLYLNSVLNNDSVKLIEKVKLAYEEYFGEIHDDCLLAFLINPVLATLGVADLKLCWMTRFLIMPRELSLLRGPFDCFVII
jgi:hypothetical protein